LRETYPHIGIIVFTAHDSQNDALRAVREYNALAYITKPILKVDQFYKAFCDAIIRHESQKEVNSKVSKKVLVTWVGIVTSIVALLSAIVAFWEKILALFKWYAHTEAPAVFTQFQLFPQWSIEDKR
jgi:DNA-binding NtrC family response regulator